MTPFIKAGGGHSCGITTAGDTYCWGLNLSGQLGSDAHDISPDPTLVTGGIAFVSVNTGGAPDANALPIPKAQADIAMDAAACIGCGACVAACRNASAMLFVSAKVSQFAHLPQGQPERMRRALNMVRAMDEEGFGNCSNHFECEAVCPKRIKGTFIAELNREYRSALMKAR